MSHTWTFLTSPDDDPLNKRLSIKQMLCIIAVQHVATLGTDCSRFSVMQSCFTNSIKVTRTAPLNAACLSASSVCLCLILCSHLVWCAKSTITSKCVTQLQLIVCSHYEEDSHFTVLLCTESSKTIHPAWLSVQQRADSSRRLLDVEMVKMDWLCSSQCLCGKKDAHMWTVWRCLQLGSVFICCWLWSLNSVSKALS